MISIKSKKINIKLDLLYLNNNNNKSITVESSRVESSRVARPAAVCI